MKIEGHFTASEIRSAMNLNATANKLGYNKICLNFPTQAAYDQWFADQKKTHPNVWGTFLLLSPRKSREV